jgi:hypothetical protein
MGLPGGGEQLLRVDHLDEFGEDGGDIVEPPTLVGIAHELEGGRLCRCHTQRSAWRVLVHDGRSSQVLPSNELDAHFTALEGPAIRFDHDLEGLRPLVSGAVQLRGAEQCCVVRLPKMLHQFRNELLCRQADQSPVRRRHDDVETVMGIGDFSLGFQAPKGSAHGGYRIPEGRNGFVRAEVMPAARGQLDDVF